MIASSPPDEELPAVLLRYFAGPDLFLLRSIRSRALPNGLAPFRIRLQAGASSCRQPARLMLT